LSSSSEITRHSLDRLDHCRVRWAESGSVNLTV
jgi:hypothetical protein